MKICEVGHRRWHWFLLTAPPTPDHDYDDDDCDDGDGDDGDDGGGLYRQHLPREIVHLNTAAGSEHIQLELALKPIWQA